MDYFAAFPDFTINPGEQRVKAFKRLAKSQKWSIERRTSERTKFHKLVVEDLNGLFNKLEHFQDLCDNLFPLEPTPTSISQCKKLLQSKFVNIWDIFEGDYKCFDTYAEFRKYTTKGRIFNRNLAKGLFFNVFLRKL
ncbi:hypothetical protein BGZ65_001381 [Modicella reniformis]|uniref:Uncharacterized protein n=1 Tax=Modicella reniformis TaxID=1440133 RepID=A0A9P6MJ63_9FUNG|nr:hypothetical protein BGZ65_001381 [Modicella reniformis]